MSRFAASALRDAPLLASLFLLGLTINQKNATFGIWNPEDFLRSFLSVNRESLALAIFEAIIGFALIKAGVFRRGDKRKQD